jgi:hypothetical protein
LSPRRGAKTVPCSAADVAARQAFAQASIDEAGRMLGQSSANNEVAASLAVLAAIAAADAICGKKHKAYSRGQDHRQAVDLLKQVDPTGPKLAKLLQEVLKHKDDAHYSPRLITDKAAENLVRQAGVIVQAAADLR